MAQVSYGGTPGGASGIIPGDSVILSGASILDWHRQPLSDHAAYTCTRHTIRVRSLYNPLATSATVANQSIVQRIGHRAPLTDVALRHHLEQYRRQLIIKIGPTVVLNSPRGGFSRDVTGGPFVIVNDVSLISGTKTFVVDLTFQTDINECYLFGTTRTILAHTWRMEHDIDQDHFTTRYIHGHATLNLEELSRLGANADDFRSYLFHPIPQHMQRVSIQAVVDEVGGQLYYTLIDRERAQSLIAAGVTRIEATHASSTEKGDFWDAAAGSLVNATGAQANFLRARGRGGVVDLAVDLGRNLLNFVRKNVPVNVQTVECSCWGNRATSRELLQLTAMQVCEWRLQHLLNAGNGTHAILMEDLAGKYAHARMSVTSGFVNQVMAGGFRPDWPALPGEGPRGNLPRGLKREEIPRVLDPIGGRANPAPPQDGGARGTYVESLVASALLAPCTTPPTPPATPRATSRTP